MAIRGRGGSSPYRKPDYTYSPFDFGRKYGPNGRAHATPKTLSVEPEKKEVSSDDLYSGKVTGFTTLDPNEIRKLKQPPF